MLSWPCSAPASSTATSSRPTSSSTTRASSSSQTSASPRSWVWIARPRRARSPSAWPTPRPRCGTAKPAVSDHYAFGALLFQCLTGRSVFNGNYAEIYRHHLHTPPDLDALPAETPLALRDMIGECLAKAPEQRPQSAALLLSAVEAARREMSADTGATVFVQQNVEPKRLGPWVIESRSADRAWTFLCNHQTSGEKALLELHFADELAYMELLRKAVDVNSSLVPLGAERLIGTSRLVMRPGEAWQNAPTAPSFSSGSHVRSPLPHPRLAPSPPRSSRENHRHAEPNPR